MKIKCLEFSQHGENMYVGKIKVKDFFSLNYKVDEWKPSLLNSPEQGYQRAPEPLRAKRFGRYVNNRRISPPSLLLSIRNTDVEKHVKVTNRAGNGIVDLEIDNKCSIYIVDGQHRIRGLEGTDIGGKLADFELPFVLLYGKDKYEEAEQFVIINKTHKVVRTDLAERFVQEAARKKGQLALASDPNAQIFKNSEWIGGALEVIDALNGRGDSGGVWYQKIRLPNESRGNMTTVAQKSFSDSLKWLLDPSIEAPLSHMPISDVIDIIEAYWNAIRRICPEPFNDPDKSNRYAVQNTIGVMSLHRLLFLLYKNLTAQVLKKEHFEKLLDVEEIRKAEYWDRELPIKGSDLKGGRWTLAGTNNKSFRIIADEIFLAIKESDAFKKLHKQIAIEEVPHS